MLHEGKDARHRIRRAFQGQIPLMIKRKFLEVNFRPEKSGHFVKNIKAASAGFKKTAHSPALGGNPFKVARFVESLFINGVQFTDEKRFKVNFAKQKKNPQKREGHD